MKTRNNNKKQKNMEKRFLVIKSKETRQAIKTFVFNLCDFENVNEMKNVYLLDFCEFNDLDYKKYFCEITK